MSRTGVVALVVFLSVMGGLVGGLFWRLGNWAAGAGMVRLVAVAIPTNIVVALAFYYALRASSSLIDGGLVVLAVFTVLNFVIAVSIAVKVAGAWSAGDAGGIGAHTFTWGLSYAYGQAFHDVRAGTWLHDE